LAYGTFIIDGRRFVRMICGECGVEHYFPEALDAKNLELGPKGGWSCPNGHTRIYSESAADKMSRERDRALQQIAQRDDEIAYIKKQRDLADRRVSAAKGQITRIKKRAANGVCPCCNRTFADLARHMAGKHPGFAAEPTADEHVH
jgi:hypothetical protein